MCSVIFLWREELGQVKNGSRSLRLVGKPANNPMERGGHREPRGRKSGTNGLAQSVLASNGDLLREVLRLGLKRLMEAE